MLDLNFLPPPAFPLLDLLGVLVGAIQSFIKSSSSMASPENTFPSSKMSSKLKPIVSSSSNKSNKSSTDSTGPLSFSNFLWSLSPNKSSSSSPNKLSSPSLSPNKSSALLSSLSPNKSSRSTCLDSPASASGDTIGAVMFVFFDLTLARFLKCPPNLCALPLSINFFLSSSCFNFFAASTFASRPCGRIFLLL